MPSKAIAIPVGKNVIEPFQHPAPELAMSPPSMQPWVMAPPTLSPLHMSPPSMELPNFSPTQDHMPLPTLTASTFTPPQSFLTYHHYYPISVVKFSRHDPTVLAVAGDTKEGGDITIFRVEDVRREVRDDAEIIARGVYDVCVKIRPRLHEISSLPTDGAITDLFFSPHDPNILFASLVTGHIAVFMVKNHNITPLSPYSSTPITAGAIHTLAFSPSRILAAATGEGVIILTYELETIHSLPIPSRAVTISGDGRRLFAADTQGVIHAWSLRGRGPPRQVWTYSMGDSITAVLAWPVPFGSDVGRSRKLLLTAGEGEVTVLDVSSRPVVELQTLPASVYNLAPLPPLPVKAVSPGVFSDFANPDVELEYELQGVLAAGRVFTRKQKFEEVFLPRRDGSDIVDQTTDEGVKRDHEGREKVYWWYNLADIEEHGESKVVAGDAVAVIDFDPLFKDSGEQRKRRGWRLCSASRDGKMCFWQVYVE